MRPQRSRMAYYGSNALNKSSSADDPENYMIPTYSAFNGRGGSNLLRDFHYELSSLRNSRGGQKEIDVFSPRSEPKSKPPKRIHTEQVRLQQTQSIYSEPDILDNVETITPKLFAKPKKQPSVKSKLREGKGERLREREQYSLQNVRPSDIQLKPDSMSNDRILLELMNIKDRISLNEQMRMQQPYMYQPPPQLQQPPVQQRSSTLQDKMLEMIMKMSLEKPQQQQPIIIQSPQVPNYYPPAPTPPPQQAPKYPYPYPQPPPRKKQYSPEPRNQTKYPPTQLPPPPPSPLYAPPPRQQYIPQYPYIAPKKNMKYVRRRLRKILWAVAFPFLLKKYSQKLILVRKQYMINNLAGVLVESADLIKEWFRKSSLKTVSMLTHTFESNLEFHEDEDQEVAGQKMKKVANLLDMTMVNLQDTSTIQVTNQFLPFISVTCDDRSFIHQNFITNKQLQYIEFSNQHRYQYLDFNQQSIQIILFVFIKVIIYDLLFQPWRLDKNLTKEATLKNLMLLGYVLYYCTQQVLNDKLKNIKPRGYEISQKEQNNTKMTESQKSLSNFTWNKMTYLDGVKGIEYVEKIRNYRRGDFWKNWKRQIIKIGNKLHKEMINKKPIINKVFKELEIKFVKGKETKKQEYQNTDIEH